MFTVPLGVSQIEKFEMLLAVLNIGLAVWLFNSWWIPKIEKQSCLFEIVFYTGCSQFHGGYQDRNVFDMLHYHLNNSNCMRTHLRTHLLQSQTAHWWWIWKRSGFCHPLKFPAKPSASGMLCWQSLCLSMLQSWRYASGRGKRTSLLCESGLDLEHSFHVTVWGGCCFPVFFKHLWQLNGSISDPFMKQMQLFMT